MLLCVCSHLMHVNTLHHSHVFFLILWTVVGIVAIFRTTMIGAITTPYSCVSCYYCHASHYGHVPLSWSSSASPAPPLPVQPAPLGYAFAVSLSSPCRAKVSDISDYWKADLGLLPFMPTDNVAETDLPDDVDPSFRLKYLEPPC